MSRNEFKVMVASLGVAVAVLQGCGKYEDGPSISLRTKNSRITGEWKLISLGNETLQDEEISFEFKKDGDFIQTYTYRYYGSQSYSSAYEGSWDWISGKESVLVKLDGESAIYDIKKLTNEELILEYSYGFLNVEFKFEKQ